MKKAAMSVLASLLGASLAMPALAERDPLAPMNHDFDSYYKEGIILPTADSVEGTELYEDFGQRDRTATPMKSFPGLPEVAMTDGGDTVGSHMGDPLK